jgi:hypothetical protein
MLLVITILLATALAASCGMTDERTEVEPELSGAAEEQLDDAKVATQEAARAMRGYAFAQRMDFANERRTEMAEIQKELERLLVKADGANDAMKADAKAKLDAARAKWSEAKRQLDLAESATESNWDDVQNGFNKSYGELQAAFDEARQRLSDEIEP